jgi:predicted dinucleotide-binding enzyme
MKIFSTLSGDQGKRNLVTIILIIVLGLCGNGAAWAQAGPVKIGIIGTGRIGGALARHWIDAGYEVLMSSRHPDQLQPLADELGPRARVGTPQEAAAFGDVVVVSVPYSATPQIGRDYSTELAGKVVLDTGNPFAQRDGPMAAEALKKGVGQASAEFLPGTRLVRAYNCIPAAALANDANREPERIAIPIASNDEGALEVAQRLIRDSGFDPVVVGSLQDSRLFELGQPLASGQFTANEMRQKLKELKRDE